MSRTLRYTPQSVDDFEAPTLRDRIGRLGRYTLLTELAEGGMSKVYLARRDGSPSPCVLKQLHVELEHHPTAARRFQREAHIVAHMDHPGVAKILGAGPEAGKFCIAMEYVAGQTLEAVLDRREQTGRKIPPPIAVAVTLRVLEALAYAHNLADAEGNPLHLVHRDLCPGNIMLAYDGKVKIIDFGVAQVRIDSFRTAPGMMVGTLRYMSPEQAATSEVDHRSDLYTVAAVLFEMLCGRPVVAKAKAVEVLEAIVDQPPPQLSRFANDLPQDLESVLTRGLAKKPDQRYQSAAAFHDALRTAAIPLARANQTHIGLLVSQLFPEEEMAAHRWQNLGSSPRPFAALDTEDWGGASFLTSSESNSSGFAALPPLRSTSLRPAAPDPAEPGNYAEREDVLTTLETAPRRQIHEAESDPAPMPSASHTNAAFITGPITGDVTDNTHAQKTLTPPPFSRDRDDTAELSFNRSRAASENQLPLVRPVRESSSSPSSLPELPVAREVLHNGSIEERVINERSAQRAPASGDGWARARDPVIIESGSGSTTSPIPEEYEVELGHLRRRVGRLEVVIGILSLLLFLEAAVLLSWLAS